jgi:ABC-type dipeptide/oligopeptide/nickel transport system permease component
VKLDILPISGMQSIDAREDGFFGYWWDRAVHDPAHLLPDLRVARVPIALRARLVAGGVRQDYIRTARGQKGSTRQDRLHACSG